MPSPFPGMDPYLESPDLWPHVHARFIADIQGALNSRLRPNYVARIEVRVYIDTDEPEGRRIVPDVRVETSRKRKTEVASSDGALMISEPVILPSLLGGEVVEAYLTIRHRESNTLVGVLEAMSPPNKQLGSEGRQSFMEKRREVLASAVHWIEIDLLRARTPSTSTVVPTSDYHVLVSRGDERRRTRCWPISLRERLPVIGIPLRGKDPDVPLDLAAVFDKVYDTGAYDLSIDYSGPADPLPPDDAKWARKLLRAKGVK